MIYFPLFAAKGILVSLYRWLSERRGKSRTSAIEIVGSKLSHESFYRDEIGEAWNGSGRLTRVSADRTTNRSFNSNPAAASISAIIRCMGLESRALELHSLFSGMASTERFPFVHTVSKCFCPEIGKCRLPHFACALVFIVSIFSEGQYL